MHKKHPLQNGISWSFKCISSNFIFEFILEMSDFTSFTTAQVFPFLGLPLIISILIKNSPF